jgi:homoserine kinase
MAAATGPYTFTVRDPTGVATCATLPNAIGVTISGSGTSTLVITGDAANNALMQTDFYITSSAPANELVSFPTP